MKNVITEYTVRARGSVLRGRRVRRVKGWPVGRNGNGLVEFEGETFVLPLRALRKVKP